MPNPTCRCHHAFDAHDREGLHQVCLHAGCNCERYEADPKPTRKHVECDEEECDAFDQPITPEEVEAAYLHWRDHGLMSGCSHAR